MHEQEIEINRSERRKKGEEKERFKQINKSTRKRGAGPGRPSATTRNSPVPLVALIRNTAHFC
jgi:hypothetical protein